jgi:predicted acetyltransferase
VSHELRAYERERDLDAVTRIWREIAWLDADASHEPLGRFLDAGQAEVAVLDGSAECMVHWTPGSIRYQDTDLDLCAVTAVTTSRIGRKQGFATTLTARAVGAGAAGGAAVAALGMFEQGFYDRVGFGTGVYEHQVSFDPSSLAVDHVPYRRPARLGPDDYEEIHGALARRHRAHGSVVLDAPSLISSEMAWLDNPFALGYRQDGRLTHVVVGDAQGENGPYKVAFLGYEEPAQLLELLRLLKELSDQVATVTMMEPAEIQLQDVVQGPIRQRTRSRASAHECGIRSLAWWQLRILDLEACVAARSWPGPEVRFNLSLSDPVAGIAAGDWTGVDGDYVVTIGAKSSAEPGTDPSLDRLTATVNAFSRCWFGVRPASSLALSDRLAGPDHLLERLDQALLLPSPRPGWDF